MGNAPKTLQDAIEELEVAQDEIARLNQQVKDLKEEVRKVRSERDDYQADYDAASDKLKTMQPILAPCPICGSPLGEDVETWECSNCALWKEIKEKLMWIRVSSAISKKSERMADTHRYAKELEQAWNRRHEVDKSRT